MCEGFRISALPNGFLSKLAIVGAAPGLIRSFWNANSDNSAEFCSKLSEKNMADDNDMQLA